MSCYQLPAGVYTGSLWAYFVCMSVSVQVTKHSIARPSWRGSNCQTRIAFKWPMRCQSLRFRQPTELVDFSLQCDWCRNIGRSSRQKEERQVPVFFLEGDAHFFPCLLDVCHLREGWMLLSASLVQELQYFQPPPFGIVQPHTFLTKILSHGSHHIISHPLAAICGRFRVANCTGRAL